MRLVFLGTGTSAGVPAIACDCAVCRSDDPRDKRLRAGAAVLFTDASGQERVVLIDATPDLRQQALRAGLRRCDAVVFTHNHVDHTFGLDELRRFNVVQNAPIDIYAEAHTMGHLRRVYQHIFDKELNVQPSFVATLIPHIIDEHRPLDLFGVWFTPIRLLHGRLPILGFRIEPARAGDGSLYGRPLSAGTGGDGEGGAFPLAYCTDVSAIPPESWAKLHGLRTLVLDGLRHRRHPTHFTLQEAVSVAERVRPARTYFTHMAHDLPHAETNASLPEGMELAYDGLVLE
jgi:phosphoribosyl 1,2-cyclic phosphate phosphodiesterase